MKRRLLRSGGARTGNASWTWNRSPRNRTWSPSPPGAPPPSPTSPSPPTSSPHLPVEGQSADLHAIVVLQNFLLNLSVPPNSNKFLAKQKTHLHTDVVYRHRRMEAQFRGGGGGGSKVSANEYSCAHGAQKNIGDLTPYLTYVCIQNVSTKKLNRVPCCIF